MTLIEQKEKRDHAVRMLAVALMQFGDAVEGNPVLSPAFSEIRFFVAEALDAERDFSWNAGFKAGTE